MNRFVCFAFAIVFVQISSTETGLIKDVITSLSGGGKKINKPSESYSPDPNYKNTTWFIENEDYLTPNTNTSTQSGNNRPDGSHNNSGFSNKPGTETSSGSSHHRPSGSHNNSGFSNRPSTETSSGFSNSRPNGSHNNSGFSSRPTTELLSGSTHYRPDTDTTLESTHHNSGFSNRPTTESSSGTTHYRPNTESSHHRPNTNTFSGSSHNRPTGSYHNSGLSNRPPNYGNFPSSPSSSSSNNQERTFSGYENQRDGTGEQLRVGDLTQDHTKRGSIRKEDELGKPVPFIPEETPVPEPLANPETRLDGNFGESDDGNNIILTSDNSITCCYSNIKDENIGNRHLRCNETDCVLEKNSEKSSLWICKNIKCNVANVDFTQNVENKKLIECAMDARNIIKVQDRPIACGPDEREHNGRCRKVFEYLK